MASLQKFKNGCRNLVARIKKGEGNPHKIALGIAIGVFVGVTPSFPFHTAIALGLAMLLRGSRIAAAAGVWVSNPVTLPLFYIASYRTGAYFLGAPALQGISKQSMTELVHTGLDVTHATILGSLLIGAILSVIAYFSAFQLIIIYKNRVTVGAGHGAAGMPGKDI